MQRAFQTALRTLTVAEYRAEIKLGKQTFVLFIFILVFLILICTYQPLKLTADW